MALPAHLRHLDGLLDLLVDDAVARIARGEMPDGFVAPMPGPVAPDPRRSEGIRGRESEDRA